MTLEPNDPRHGTDSSYCNHACRCPACREAHRLGSARRSVARGGRTSAWQKAQNRAVSLVRTDYPDVWAACMAKAKAEVGYEDSPDRRRKP